MEDIAVEFVDAKGIDDLVTLGFFDKVFEMVNGAAKDAKVLVTATKKGKFFLRQVFVFYRGKELFHGPKRVTFFPLPVPGGRTKEEEIGGLDFFWGGFACREHGDLVIAADDFFDNLSGKVSIASVGGVDNKDVHNILGG